jgi:hypothetical protein
LTANERTRRYSANAARNAARRLAAAQSEAPAATHPEDPADIQPLTTAESFGRPSRAVILAAIAIVASCGVLLALMIYYADYWTPIETRKPAAIGATTPAASGTGAAGKPDFADSYERLGRALSSFPGANPGDVIRAAGQVVPEAAKGCAVRWQGGEAALQFGKDAGASGLAAAIGHCADAVEGLRSHLADAQAKSRRDSGY